VGLDRLEHLVEPDSPDRLVLTERPDSLALQDRWDNRAALAPLDWPVCQDSLVLLAQQELMVYRDQTDWRAPLDLLVLSVPLGHRELPEHLVQQVWPARQDQLAVQECLGRTAPREDLEQLERLGLLAVRGRLVQQDLWEHPDRAAQSVLRAVLEAQERKARPVQPVQVDLLVTLA